MISLWIDFSKESRGSVLQALVCVCVVYIFRKMSRPVERESNQEFWTHSTTMSLIGASWELAVIKPFSFRPFFLGWIQMTRIHPLSRHTHTIHNAHTFIYLWIDWGNSSKMYFELNFLLKNIPTHTAFLELASRSNEGFVWQVLFFSLSLSLFFGLSCHSLSPILTIIRKTLLCPGVLFGTSFSLSPIFSISTVLNLLKKLFNGIGSVLEECKQPLIIMLLPLKYTHTLFLSNH